MAGNWGSWRLSPFPHSPVKPGWTQDTDSDLLGGSLCILSSDNSSSFTDRPVLKTVYLVLILFPSGLNSLWKCTENLTHENYLPTERDCNKWIRLPEPATTRQELDLTLRMVHGGCSLGSPGDHCLLSGGCPAVSSASRGSKAGVLRAHGCCSPPHLGDEHISGTRVCLHTRCAS